MTSPPRLRLVRASSDEPELEAGEASGAAPRAIPADGVDEPPLTLDNELDPPLPAPARDPAAAEEAARRARREQLARQAVTALVALQFLAVMGDAPRDWQFARAGAVAPPAWLALPACTGLWAATAWLATGRARGGTRTAFLLSAAGLALAVPFWGLASPLTWPFELGATLALAGAWLVKGRRARLALAGGDDPLP